MRTMEINGHNAPYALDTLASFDALVATGFSEDQARGMLDVFQKQSAAAEVATKIDIERVRAELTRDIESVKADLEAKIESLRADLEAKIESVRADLEVTKAELKSDIESVRAELKKDIADTKVWLSGMIFAAVGLLAAFMAFLRFFTASAS